MICRLCHREKQLRRSHILPDFFRDPSGTLYPTGKSGQPQPFTQIIHTNPGKKFLRKQHGYWEVRLGLVENLLCQDCEQEFSAIEDYAKRFFYGGSNPLRLQLPINQESFAADYKRMKLFQLSILWRASEAKGEFFFAVALSDEHRERLRLMLLNGDPGGEDEYCCAMNRMVVSPILNQLFVAHGIAIETGTFAPISHRNEGWVCYFFMMGGLTLLYCVSEIGVPEMMRHTYVRENGFFFLLPMNCDSFFMEFSQKVVQAGNLTKADVEESIKAKRGQ